MADEVEVEFLPPCDIHFHRRGETVDAQYDAKTSFGPWAYMCQECMDKFGPGRLGTGYGQKLVLRK